MPIISILTSPDDIHAQAVCLALKRKKCQRKTVILDFSDINLYKHLALSSQPESKMASLKIGRSRIFLRDIRTVWYRKHRRSNLARDHTEAFLDSERDQAYTAFVASLQAAFWVNPYFSEYRAENKLAQLQTAQEIGLMVPRTLISSDPRIIRDFFKSCNSKMVYKLMGSCLPGRGMVYTSLISAAVLKNSAALSAAPCLMQEFIPKQADVRVNVIGTRVFATKILSQEQDASKVDFRAQEDYWYKLKHEPLLLPSRLQSKCAALVRRLGLRFGAIDFALTPSNDFIFLEINPSAQWTWIENLTGQPLLENFCELLAQGRVDYKDSSLRRRVRLKDLAGDLPGILSDDMPGKPYAPKVSSLTI